MCVCVYGVVRPFVCMSPSAAESAWVKVKHLDKEMCEVGYQLTSPMSECVNAHNSISPESC